jgi:hypothetical protein
MLSPAGVEFEFAIPVAENATMFELKSDVSLAELNSRISAELVENYLTIEIDSHQVWQLCIDCFKSRIFALDIGDQLFGLDYDTLKITMLAENKVLLSMYLDQDIFYKG